MIVHCLALIPCLYPRPAPWLGRGSARNGIREQERCPGIAAGYRWTEKIYQASYFLVPRPLKLSQRIDSGDANHGSCQANSKRCHKLSCPLISSYQERSTHENHR